MKEKINAFLARKVNMENAITGCMITFLATIVMIIVWMTVLAGSWGNLISALKFSQILGVIERVYIGDANTNEISHLAFDTMIESLGDRWSFYMTKEEYQQYQKAQSNMYTGVGITLQHNDNGWMIVGVAKDSPADQSGISVGAYLVEVNNVVVSDMETAEISAIMQENPEHIVVVISDIEGNTETYILSMEEIYSDPVSYEMKENMVGYIKLENFDATCADNAIAAINHLMEQGAQGIVFDVRNNGGGYVTELCELLDYLLPEGDIFVSVDHKGNEKITKSDREHIDFPMAVLVNENSYSAAEFFAAALKEYDAAVIVGAPTTGKNRSQINMILADGSAVHISSKQYLTPNRVDLTQQGGLTPDVIIEAGDNDPQLVAALEIFH